MPRDGAITFRDIVRKLTVLRITCDKCGRSGQYRVDRLIMRYGIDAKLFDWSDEITADWTTHVPFSSGFGLRLRGSLPSLVRAGPFSVENRLCPRKFGQGLRDVLVLPTRLGWIAFDPFGWAAQFSGDRFPGSDGRPVALRAQVISRLEGGLGTPSRAKARAKHPGINSHCVINIDPHFGVDDTFATIGEKLNCRAGMGPRSAVPNGPFFVEWRAETGRSTFQPAMTKGDKSLGQLAPFCLVVLFRQVVIRRGCSCPKTGAAGVSG